MTAEWVQIVDYVQRIGVGVAAPVLGGLLIAYGVAKLKPKSNENAS